MPATSGTTTSSPVGGAAAPGEKAWEVLGIFVVFPMRIAACIGFLQMKRWGHQWMIVTCWTGVLMWIGYVANMTDLRRHPLHRRRVPGRSGGGSTTSSTSRRSSRSRTCTPSTARSSRTEEEDIDDGRTIDTRATSRSAPRRQFGQDAHASIRRVCYVLLFGLVIEGALTFPLLAIWYGVPELSPAEVCSELQKVMYSDDDPRVRDPLASTRRPSAGRPKPRARPPPRTSGASSRARGTDSVELPRARREQASEREADADEDAGEVATDATG